MSTPIVALGCGPWSGAYVLRVHVGRVESVVFGRFNDGAAVVVEPGDYLYIGSARNSRGGPILARRVLRHLTRTGNRPPQPLRTALLVYLREHGWSAAQARTTKTLRWHIDYLLDIPSAAVTHVLLIRDDRAGEHELVAWLAQTGLALPLHRGLGASDHPGHTHLLQWTAGDRGWQQFIDDTARRFAR